MRDVEMRSELIEVRVSLFGALRRFAVGGAAAGADGVCDLRLPSGTTLAELRARLGIPASSEITAGVNGDQANADRVLQAGDRVVLFNALSGGAGLG